MLVAVDVSYDRVRSRAAAAAVLFHGWQDAVAAREYTVGVPSVAAYVPGQFYRRELPCLLQVLAAVEEPITTVLVDGYVRMGARPGLGWHLWQAVDECCAVVGIAKSPFRGAEAIAVLRGGSRRPLYVTAAGIDPLRAAESVRNMHGPHRVPALLRRVDQLARQSLAAAST
jgi:deoxyribonuclease V